VKAMFALRDGQDGINNYSMHDTAIHDNYFHDADDDDDDMDDGNETWDLVEIDRNIG